MEILNRLLEPLQQIPMYSILVSAFVGAMVALCILTMFGKARQEKRVEEKRWEAVSANMALFDMAERIIIPLEADEILVGRHGAADIRFPSNMSISRYHAVLYVSNGIWSVMDLGSKSGTYVNGYQVKTQVKLRENDEIRFGTKAVILRDRRRR